MQPLPHLPHLATREKKTSSGKSPLIIIGLGNPGPNFRQTRHNFGFGVLDRCANLLNFTFAKDLTIQSMIATGSFCDRQLLLLKPLTFMNLSGRSLILLKKKIAFDSDQILVICDDIALPFGTLRLRLSGGSGGHNGLKSLKEALATTAFARLRVGVGQPPEGVELDEFVLNPFTALEKQEIPAIAAKAAKAALEWSAAAGE